MHAVVFEVEWCKFLYWDTEITVNFFTVTEKKQHTSVRHETRWYIYLSHSFSSDSIWMRHLRDVIQWGWGCAFRECWDSHKGQRWHGWHASVDFYERQLQRASDSVITWQRSTFRAVCWDTWWGRGQRGWIGQVFLTLALVWIWPDNIPKRKLERKLDFAGNIIPLSNSEQWRCDKKTWGKTCWRFCSNCRQI